MSYVSRNIHTRHRLYYTVLSNVAVTLPHVVIMSFDYIASWRPYLSIGRIIANIRTSPQIGETDRRLSACAGESRQNRIWNRNENRTKCKHV